MYGWMDNDENFKKHGLRSFVTNPKYILKKK